MLVTNAANARPLTAANDKPSKRIAVVGFVAD